MKCWHLLILKNPLSKRRCIELFPRAAIAKYHTLGGLKQQPGVVSQLWMSVRNQGISRAMLPLTTLRESFIVLPCLEGPPATLDAPRR